SRSVVYPCAIGLRAAPALAEIIAPPNRLATAVAASFSPLAFPNSILRTECTDGKIFGNGIVAVAARSQREYKVGDRDAKDSLRRCLPLVKHIESILCQATHTRSLQPDGPFGWCHSYWRSGAVRGKK